MKTIKPRRISNPRVKQLLKSSVKLSLINKLIQSTSACRNLGNGGHNSISHPHAQFPKHYNLEDVLVSNYCYRHYNQSCPTCHTHGLLEYSCSFCIENSCEQETCGKKWGWLNQLEECRQTIISTETLETNLDRLQIQFDQLISGNGPEQQIAPMLRTTNNDAVNSLTSDNLSDTTIFDSEELPNVQSFHHDAANSQALSSSVLEESSKYSVINHNNINNEHNYNSELEAINNGNSTLSISVRTGEALVSSSNGISATIISDDIDELEVPSLSRAQGIITQQSEQTNNQNGLLYRNPLTLNDGKFPPLNIDYRIYCADPTAELNKATLRCYAQCPPNYNRFGVSCFSNCATPQKDEFSTYCIEPEVRKPIELFSSCAEDCNENNIHDFCFACPEGMHKKDCQCVKSEKIEFREILERSYTNAIMLLID